MQLRSGVNIEGELKRIENELHQLAARVGKARIIYIFNADEPSIEDENLPTPARASPAVGDRVRVRGTSFGSRCIIGTVTFVSKQQVHIKPDGSKSTIIREPHKVTPIGNHDGKSRPATAGKPSAAST
jgi:hypothetical protein